MEKVEILNKLIALANNNPNEHEANAAARRVCKMLADIESAFREYARAHKGCTKQIEDKAWKDFLSKLRKRL